MGKIVLVGSLIADTTTYVDRYPVTGESVFGTPATLGPGGKGNNQATAACCAGCEVWMVGKLGGDIFSGMLMDNCHRVGMKCDYIYQDKEAQTGTALVQVLNSTGDNRIVIGLGANELLTPEEVQAAESAFAECDVVLTQLETNQACLNKTKELAQKYGKPLVLNPAPAKEIPVEFFDGLDYFTPNETEAAFFTGAPVETDEQLHAAGKALLAKGVKHVIITLGKRGAFYMDSERSLFVPSFHVKAVDTTGAGDAFNGGFCTALAEGKNIEEALRFGCAVAGLSVTRRGAAFSMPSREEVEAFLAQQA